MTHKLNSKSAKSAPIKRLPWARPQVRRLNAGNAETGINFGPEAILLLS